MGEVRNEIAEKLLYYRKLKGITQRQLAESIGVKHNSISAWEKGTNAIDIEVLYRICRVLDITISDIYGRFGDNGNPDAKTICNYEISVLLHSFALSKT